jgi:hypothetical protein
LPFRDGRGLGKGGDATFLVDGSTRFILNGVDLQIWRGLDSIAGGETLPDSF